MDLSILFFCFRLQPKSANDLALKLNNSTRYTDIMKTEGDVYENKSIVKIK